MFITATPMPIIDFKTNKSLTIKTEMSYAFQNQQTKTYLIWAGSGTDSVATAPVKTDPKYWHVFAKLIAPVGGYYRMTHGLPASQIRHVTKVAAAPGVNGYVMLFNKQCGDDTNPNLEQGGVVKCAYVQNQSNPGPQDTPHSPAPPPPPHPPHRKRTVRTQPSVYRNDRHWGWAERTGCTQNTWPSSPAQSLALPIIVLGSAGVGKSALIVQFVQETFVDNYDPTIEDTYRKYMIVDGHHYMVEIVDTAGTRQFSAMREQYIRCGHGFVLVYSIADKSTFAEALAIRRQILEIRANGTDGETGGTGVAVHPPLPPMILVGNKSDLIDEREVSTFRAAHTVNRELNGCPFVECSAKCEINVSEVFTDVVRQINGQRGSDGTDGGPGAKKPRRRSRCYFNSTTADPTKVHQAIVDKMTNTELPLKTDTYYVAQNHKTGNWLVWAGGVGTVSQHLDIKKIKYQHIFHKMDHGWYKMIHHNASHTVQVAKSDNEAKTMVAEGAYDNQIVCHNSAKNKTNINDWRFFDVEVY
ncbi:unnamed protein product [Medioppia subpectinata]|uniref:Uncharacterized protein n=1 Tax=Medioppia subpectinata TaxID=1979941 RepID=A0A7R9KQU1_9ACAR|nr:unnamed protein product [Medioppia subpectinata]CAG2106716.1 unnamed protein product [Medioppia subpectinata]